MRSFLSVALAALCGVNGLVMLVAGAWWYGAIPGVTETGPYNPHFVRDIGAAYLVSGLAFGWRALRAAGIAQGAAVAGAGFLAVHGLIHLVEATTNPGGLADLARDFPAVIAPALVAVWVAWPTAQSAPETRHA